MRPALLLLLLVIGSLASFTGYCAAIIDWVLDYRTGVYERNYGEAFWETAGLCLYTFLGIRFVRLKCPVL